MWSLEGLIGAWILWPRRGWLLGLIRLVEERWIEVGLFRGGGSDDAWMNAHAANDALLGDELGPLSTRSISNTASSP